MKSNRGIEIDAETAQILSRIAEAGDDLASILKAFPVDPTEFAEFLEEIGESDTEAAQMIIHALSGGSYQETEITSDGTSDSIAQKVSGSERGLIIESPSPTHVFISYARSDGAPLAMKLSKDFTERKLTQGR